jgi:hypothetical protein
MMGEGQMRPIQIGLVDKTQAHKHFVSASIDDAVTAFNVQIAQHLSKCWSRARLASVLKLPMDNPEVGQAGVWPIILVDSLEEGVGGFHSTKHHQPYAKVAVTDADWTISASHEILEMLVDPGGNGLEVGPAVTCEKGQIQDKSGQSEYLLEICDPCAAKEFAYRVNGKIWVSDFVTPDYYSCGGVPDGRYSFRHNIAQPRRVLKGGYIGWVLNDRGDISIGQITYFDAEPKQHVIKSVALDQTKPNLRNFRAYADSHTHSMMHKSAGSVGNQQKYSSVYTAAVGEKPKGNKDSIQWEDHEHWVTYHHDGMIEREVHTKEGAKVTCIEMVKAHEPILRCKGTKHKIKNIGCGPIALDKDLINPQ